MRDTGCLSYCLLNNECHSMSYDRNEARKVCAKIMGNFVEKVPGESVCESEAVFVCSCRTVTSYAFLSVSKLSSCCKVLNSRYAGARSKLDCGYVAIASYAQKQEKQRDEITLVAFCKLDLSFSTIDASAATLHVFSSEINDVTSNAFVSCKGPMKQAKGSALSMWGLPFLKALLLLLPLAAGFESQKVDVKFYGTD